VRNITAVANVADWTLNMCCQPDHIGPPPGWYEGTAEVETMAEIRAAIAAVSMAERLNVLAACLHEGHQRGSGPGRGPRSTEGGRGRALPGHGGRPADVAAALAEFTAVADTGAEAAWTQRPRR